MNPHIFVKTPSGLVFKPSDEKKFVAKALEYFETSQDKIYGEAATKEALNLICYANSIKNPSNS